MRKKVRLEDVPRYLELLPYMAEYADGIVDTALEESIEIILFSETRDETIAGQYRESIKITKLGDRKRMVRFEPTNDRIKAIETGIRPFSIKEKMLSSPKAKMSKDGHKYMTIPISKDAARKPTTNKDAAVREKINEVIRGSRFSLQFAGANESGEYVVQDKTRDIRRKRVFASESDYRNRKKPISREHIIFRTMSSKPGTSDWFHPGSSGKNIVSQIDRWLADNEEKVFEEAFDSMFEMFFGS